MRPSRISLRQSGSRVGQSVRRACKTSNRSSRNPRSTTVAHRAIATGARIELDGTCTADRGAPSGATVYAASPAALEPFAGKSGVAPDRSVYDKSTQIKSTTVAPTVADPPERARSQRHHTDHARRERRRIGDPEMGEKIRHYRLEIINCSRRIRDDLGP